MPRTITIQLFQYSELSDTAKAKARDWMREVSAPDSYFSESILEDFQTVATACGFSIGTTPGRRSFPAIYWEGFSHQGQGASFDASWAAERVDGRELEKLKADRPATWQDDQGKTHRCDSNGELHLILQLARDLAAADPEAGGTVKASRRGHCLECFYQPLGQFAKTSESFTMLCNDLAHWLYRNLEREYDYQNSDEVIAENIEANEYEFTAEGKRA